MCLTTSNFQSGVYLKNSVIIQSGSHMKTDKTCPVEDKYFDNEDAN